MLLLSTVLYLGKAEPFRSKHVFARFTCSKFWSQVLGFQNGSKREKSKIKTLYLFLEVAEGEAKFSQVEFLDEMAETPRGKCFSDI